MGRRAPQWREDQLRGRSRECAALDALLERVRAGASPVLVLRGEPGIGKTALLDYARERATGCRVARVAGVESEMELAFAGLHQLCVPMLDRLDRLPAPQRAALAAAFGLSAGGAPDRLLVGLAVLGLLSEVADEQPLLCIVDDAHWLDRASMHALAFVARRLGSESVALLFAIREPNGELSGLPELEIRGLADADARGLLTSTIPGPLDRRVSEQILLESRGNPLALAELPHVVELAGGFGLPSLPLSGRIEDSFLRRLERLPTDTRRLLLVAAAEPLGEPVLLWGAAERLGIGADAAGPAETERLLHIGARVRFHHPLVRSAIYRAAPAGDRRDVHLALSEVTDPHADPDRRAWHRAHAALTPDEDLAAELERSAGRAQSRGGIAAAAAFLQQSVALTPDLGRRARRALAAAQAKYEAGDHDAAIALLATAEIGPLGELERARVTRLRAEVQFSVTRGSDAPLLLLSAAQQLAPLDAALARETYLDALAAATFLSSVETSGGLQAVARAAQQAPPPVGTPRSHDFLLDGLATRFTAGYSAAAPTLKRALAEARRETPGGGPWVLWMWVMVRAAADLWDDEAFYEISVRQLRFARDTGALALLPVALYFRAVAHTLAGEFAAATAVVDEASVVAESSGNVSLTHARLLVAAWSGNEAQLTELIEATVREASARGEGAAMTMADLAQAVLGNGLGRYDEALAAAERACSRDELGLASWAPAELVEAAVRSGRQDLAVPVAERLSARAEAAGSEWARGISARAHALVNEGEVAEASYLESIERLERTRVASHLARSRLLYGEWLRRERRRLEAREQLRTAHQQFTAMGAEAFAARAARELAATGERARKRVAATRDELTAQETQIAFLARAGNSNTEIGARLFISPRTVEYHMRKIFTKLEISSRTQIEDALPADAAGRPD